jgi:hypothetical protein
MEPWRGVRSCDYVVVRRLADRLSDDDDKTHGTEALPLELKTDSFAYKERTSFRPQLLRRLHCVAAGSTLWAFEAEFSLAPLFYRAS